LISPSPLKFRSAEPEDAEQVALLHADSWQRHYRGAYADSFLDGDVAANRRTVWSARLASPTNTATILAEQDDQLVGFVHVAFDEDPKWGSLVDNLHVHHSRHRSGIGTGLLARAAEATLEGAAGNGLYLWVLQQNSKAQQFYLATGAACVDTGTVPPPGGDPSRLIGTPSCLRMAWSDVEGLSRLGR